MANLAETLNADEDFQVSESDIETYRREGAVLIKKTVQDQLDGWHA